MTAGTTTKKSEATLKGRITIRKESLSNYGARWCIKATHDALHSGEVK